MFLLIVKNYILNRGEIPPLVSSCLGHVHIWNTFGNAKIHILFKMVKNVMNLCIYQAKKTLYIFDLVAKPKRFKTRKNVDKQSYFLLSD